MGRIFVAILCGVLIVGCGSAAPKPSPVEGELIAGANVNPDADGRASPVKVRIYQLSSDGQFAAADFMALYESDEAALGADLISREEFVLRPGEAAKYAGEIDPETRFVAAYAVFRDYGQATWKSSVAIPESKMLKLKNPFKDDTLIIEINELVVSVRFERK